MGDDFGAVVRVHGPRLLRVAYQLTHHAADAEDVVQAALLRVHRSLGRSGTEPDDLAAYLRRAVVNEFLRGRRRRPLEVVVTATVPDIVARGNHPDDVADHDVMWSALGRLRPRHRAALVLRYYEQLDDAEIAEVLGCRRSTVRSLVARGLAALEPELVSEGVTRP